MLDLKFQDRNPSPFSLRSGGYYTIFVGFVVKTKGALGHYPSSSLSS